MGAPALTAATRLIPAPAAAPAPSGSVAVTDRRGTSPADQVAPAPVPAGAIPAPGGAPAAGANSGTASPPARPQPVPAGARPSAAPLTPPAPSPGPAPATVAGAANGGSSGAPPRPPVAAAAAARRPAPASRQYAPVQPARSGPGRLLLIALGVLGLAALVALLLVLTTSGGSTHSAASSPASNALQSHRPAGSVTVNASSVTVAVLNGTASNGLAHRVAQKLTGAGYKEGTVETAPDQTHTSTLVAYMPGFKRDAQAVAASLKLPAATVQPVDPSSQAVACPRPAPAPPTSW